MMENHLIVTASPHIVDRSSTRKLMGNVIIALAVVVGAIIGSALVDQLNGQALGIVFG